MPTLNSLTLNSSKIGLGLEFIYFHLSETHLFTQDKFTQASAQRYLLLLFSLSPSHQWLFVLKLGSCSPYYRFVMSLFIIYMLSWRFNLVVEHLLSTSEALHRKYICVCMYICMYVCIYRNICVVYVLR
jgi:hypothetical protein